MSLSDSVSRGVEAAVTAEPVDGVLLLQRVTARERAGGRRRRRRSAAAVGLAAVAAAAAVVVPSLLTPTAPAVVSAPEPVPPGQRAVSWHGVQVLVPDTWGLDDEFCDAPQSDTVVVPGARLSCLPPLVPGLTVVEFSVTGRTPGASLAGVADRPVTVSGRPALRGTTVPDDEPTSTLAVLEVPELDVTVTVRSPDPARAQALLDTAQVVEVDALGCPSRLPSSSPPVPAVPGAADRVLPGEPVRVALCEYGDLRLEKAGTMTPEQVRDFQQLVDAAPVGTSPSRVGITVAAELCPEYDRRPLVLLASYADGASLQVFTRQNSCTGPDPDNGARQVRVSQAQIGGVYTALYASRRSPLPLGR